MELPKLRLSELCLGEQIGQGGFSQVYELSSIIIHPIETASSSASSSTDDETRTNDEKSSIQHLTDSLYFSPSLVRTPMSQRADGNDCRYVVKLLRDDLPSEEFIKGYNDLVTETEILSKISHHHIIAIRAIARTEGSATSSHTLSGGGYFLILDRLSCTLQTKLDYWKDLLASDPNAANNNITTQPPSESILGSLLSCIWIPNFQPYTNALGAASKSLLLRLWLERLIILRDIADALHYLHSHDIIYRDLVGLFFCCVM